MGSSVTFEEMAYDAITNLYLEHHGIRGQEWGKRHGPPYPLKGKQLSASEKKKKNYKAKKSDNSKYNHQHIDKTLEKDTEVQTMSFDKDRTKNSDFLYTSYRDRDKLFYQAYFNKRQVSEEKDENGEPVGYSNYCMYNITNSLAKDTKVASEDSCKKEFVNLVENNRDFSNFVTDPNRFAKLIKSLDIGVADAYSGANHSLKKVLKSEKPSEDDVGNIYKMFGYCLPVDINSPRLQNLEPQEKADLVKDYERQRARFFTACKNDGYGAIVDWNNAVAGNAGRRTAAAIIIDPEVLVPKSIVQTTVEDLKQSQKDYRRKYNPFANLLYG